jgi:hypothetical protein
VLQEDDDGVLDLPGNKEHLIRWSWPWLETGETKDQTTLPLHCC